MSLHETSALRRFKLVRSLISVHAGFGSETEPGPCEERQPNRNFFLVSLGNLNREREAAPALVSFVPNGNVRPTRSRGVSKARDKRNFG